VLVPAKPLQRCLLFVGKAGAYLRVEHQKGASIGRLRPYYQTLDLAGKAFQGKHSSLLQIVVNHGLKCFVQFGPNVTKHSPTVIYG
jgi:hypothetical protein